MLSQPHDGPAHPPEIFCRVIDHLMDPADALNEGPERANALVELNVILAREGFEAFYGDDRHCYLRHLPTHTVTVLEPNKHRPLSVAERQRRRDLEAGIQAKMGKIDAAGVSKAGNAGVAEIHHQALMMLAHEIFDPETNRRVLVDHTFIVAGGEITKAARNWLGNALDAAKRSQIMSIDRDDILNLYVVTNLPLPDRALPPQQPPGYEEPPF